MTSSPPTLEPQTIPAASAGRYYEVEFTTGGDATVHSNNVPQGLRLATGSGHGFLFGVPATEGQYSFHVSAGSGGPTMFTKPGVTERDYILTVSPATGDSGLILDDKLASFTANEPLTIDLTEAVRGGQTPYQFALYCPQSGEICGDPQSSDLLPDGVSLSADGLLSGTVAPQTGVYATPNDRRFDLIVCVTDSTSAHACGTLSLQE